MASTYLTRTLSSQGNRQKWTFSAWVKRATLDSQSTIFSTTDGGNRFSTFYFSSNTLRFYDYNNGTFYAHLKTNRLFRDTSAWYHVVAQYDTTQSTSSNRLKFYVNGVQETSFETAIYRSQNDEGYVNSAYVQNIGKESSADFNGSMSHIHFTDGYSYDASAFGETDTTTGEWKIKTSPSVTYGTKGFFILKDGNSVTDQSGQSNNWTVGSGTLTKTEDCPSNVYVTLNSLDSDLTASDKFEYGNTKVNGQTPADRKYYCSLTMPFDGNGKYYFEGVMLANNYGSLGLTSLDAQQNPSFHRRENEYCGRYDYDYGYHFPDGKVYKNTSATAYGGVSWSANDYFSFAIDNTNQKMYVAKNGSWINSANPSNGTGGIDYSAIGNNVMFIITDTNASGYNKFAFNFGNGSINGATISTTYSPTVGDTGAKFKYNIIPTGFTALSTKGLNL